MSSRWVAERGDGGRNSILGYSRCHHEGRSLESMQARQRRFLKKPYSNPELFRCSNRLKRRQIPTRGVSSSDTVQYVRCYNWWTSPDVSEREGFDDPEDKS